jgi:hypothetical protein
MAQGWDVMTDYDKRMIFGLLGLMTLCLIAAIAAIALNSALTPGSLIGSDEDYQQCRSIEQIHDDRSAVRQVLANPQNKFRGRSWANHP